MSKVLGAEKFVLACAALLSPLRLAAEQAHHQGGTPTIRGGQVQGQPWQAGSGSWRFRTFFSFLTSDSGFAPDGGRVRLANGGTFSNSSLNLFAEHAVSGRWSVSGLGSVQGSTLHDDLEKRHWTSLGDTYGWLRRSLPDWNGVAPAVLLGVKVPGTYKAAVGSGDGQADVEAQAFLTRGRGPRGYAAVNMGYRYRAGGIADELVFGGQFGWSPAPGWTLIPAVNGVKGVLAGVAKDYVGAGVSVQKSIAGSWALLAGYNRVLAGKNTVGADVWSLGVGFR